jgi:hypothetical protein
MKFVVLILSFISVIQFAYSQNTADSIYSKVENDAWLKKLNSLSNEADKLNFIKDKIRSDSSRANDSTLQRDYVENGHFHIRFINTGICKILFSLSVKKKIYFLDLAEFPKYSDIIPQLNPGNIKSIDVLNEISAPAIFGIKGHCGVVSLISNSKYLSRKLKSL